MKPGDVIRYMGKNGFMAGYFVRIKRGGGIEIEVPELNNRKVTLKPEQVLAVKEKDV